MTSKQLWPLLSARIWPTENLIYRTLTEPWIRATASLDVAKGPGARGAQQPAARGAVTRRGAALTGRTANGRRS
ncbi:MAG TPA: hypothetical protein VN277_08875, partial [Acidiferrobacterales bacterium]|nr:hypothetical protein [Acidiferrobacterales bacterium]